MRDVMFMPGDYSGADIGFVKPSPKGKAIVVGFLQADQAKIKDFIRGNRGKLDEMVETEANQASPDKLPVKFALSKSFKTVSPK